MLRLFSTLTKILIASLLTGAALSFVDITANDILAELGLTPERVMTLLTRGVEWALPNIILGSMVIIPVWIIIFLFRPPRG